MTLRTVSVIVPVKNGGDTFSTLLDRLMELSVPAGWRKEIVVGYQESSDDTLSQLTSRKIPFVVSNKIGPSANRNTAVAASSGELLYFLDADALPVEKDVLSYAVEHYTRLGATLGAMGGPILIHPGQTSNPIALADHYACWFLWHRYRREGKSFFQPTANLIVPRCVFEEVGGFDECLRVFEDFDFEQRLTADNRGVYFFRDLAIYHHARAGLMESTAHSWRWGLAVRQHFLAKQARQILPFVRNRSLFWLNFPIIFVRRLWYVVIQTYRANKLNLLICFPLLFLAVLVWSLAVVVSQRDNNAGA